MELKSRLNLSSYSFCDKDVINFAFRDNFFLFLAFRDKNVTIYDFYRKNVVFKLNKENTFWHPVVHLKTIVCAVSHCQCAG